MERVLTTTQISDTSGKVTQEPKQGGLERKQVPETWAMLTIADKDKEEEAANEGD